MRCKRTPRKTNPSQIHNQKVQQRAAKLKREGWEVQATVPPFPQPKPIGKDRRIPDITAQKGPRIKIIEVKTETDAESARSKEQLATFRLSVANRKNASFELEVVSDP